MIWVVLPALNEAENLEVLIPRVVEALRQTRQACKILVVNDGSTDDTAAVCRRLMDDHPGLVETIAWRRNLGKSPALQRGFDHALGGGADTIIMMDADGQDDPDELGRLLEGLEGADLVTGARLKRNDRFVKRTTSKLYNGVTRRLSGAPGRDFNSGYKAMRAEVAASVSPMLYGEMHRYLTVLAHHAGYLVTEVPVQHHSRMSGASKYGLARFWRGFADLVTVRFLLSYQNRPSHLFGGAGFFCFFIGVALLGYLTVLKLTGEPIGDRPLLLAGVLFTLVGLQLSLFGLLAELVVHARNGGRKE